MMNTKEWIDELNGILASGDKNRYLEKLNEYIDLANEEYSDNIFGRCALYNELGAFLRNSRSGDFGEEAFRSGIAIIEECMNNGARSDNLYLNIATLVNNLGGTYRVKKEYDKAIEAFDRAISLYEQVPDVPQDLYASGYNNKGLVFLETEQYNDAADCFNKALEKCIKKGNARGTSYSNLGFALVKMKDYKGALEAFKEAADNLKGIPSASGLYKNSTDMIKKLVNAQ